MTRETLLAIGGTIAMLGIVARTVARAQRRTIALRKQQQLADRRPGEALPAPGHFERHLGRYANGAIAAGLAVVAVALLR